MVKKGSSASITSVAIGAPSESRMSGGRQKSKPAVAASPATQSGTALAREISFRFTLGRLADASPKSAKTAAPRVAT